LPCVWPDTESGVLLSMLSFVTAGKLNLGGVKIVIEMIQYDYLSEPDKLKMMKNECRKLVSKES